MIDWKNLSAKIMLSDCQFGFRTGRSSSMAIVNLMEKITNSLDNTRTVISVFIDLKKAFDTIYHTILLQKYNHYENMALLTNWYAAIYQIGNNMYKLKEQNPTWKVFHVVSHKVQFAALNSLIYILMTFVMHQAFWNLFYLWMIQILFDHDSTTSLCNTLNTELEKLNTWSNLNKLSLNLQKTNYITFSTNNLHSIIQIPINGSNIEKVNSNNILVFISVII